MSTGAIVMMIVTIGIVWGGLLLAILRLRRHSVVPELDEGDGAGQGYAPPPAQGQQPGAS